MTVQTSLADQRHPVEVARDMGFAYQSDFPPEEFRARWDRIFDAIGSEAVAVVQGVSLTAGFVLPRQTNEFYYLCGVETPHAYLLLDGRDRRVTLYLPPRNARLEAAEGKVLSAEDAELVQRLTGVDAVRSTAEMGDDWLTTLPGGPPSDVYALFSPAEGHAQSRHEVESANRSIAADPWDGRPSKEEAFVTLLRERTPGAEVRDLTPILDDLRVVKSPREIEVMRVAAKLTARAVIEAMKSTRPGVHEYGLEAVARYVYILNGARLDGYRSIIPAGTTNIGNIHYYRNDSVMGDGDLVLMDYAPDYHYYTSDIGRMWPVNGRFSPWQRELLGFILAYHRTVMERIRPGVTTAQIQDEAKTAMEPVFARTSFSKPAYEEAARKLVETGGGVFSHAVGMAVHDEGKYHREPLKPGQVFAFDPQLRVPSEGLYLRYEDLVVVTENGYENLTADAPWELDEIERLMQEPGMIQAFPPLEN